MGDADLNWLCALIGGPQSPVKLSGMRWGGVALAVSCWLWGPMAMARSSELSAQLECAMNGVAWTMALGGKMLPWMSLAHLLVVK